MPAYKDKKKGTWDALFYYDDWHGERKRKHARGFEKKKDALDFEREFLNKQQQSCDMKFSSMVELYMRDMSSRLRLSTFKTKEYIVNDKILPFFGRHPLNKITAAHVRQWQNELIDDDSDFAPTYLKTIHNQLSAVFNYAVKYYNLHDNPCKKAGSIGKKKAESMQFWTVEEFYKYLPAVSDKPTARALFSILFWTGMRIGEALALTPADMDYEARTIRINKSYKRIDGEDIISDPKTPKSNRTITIPEHLCEEIKKYIAMLYECADNERIFEVTHSFANKEIERGSKRADVKKIRVHDLRHSHASLLIEMGFSIILIAERLGHENVETTLEIYGHLYPNKQTEVAEKIDKIMESYQNRTSE